MAKSIRSFQHLTQSSNGSCSLFASKWLGTQCGTSSSCPSWCSNWWTLSQMSWLDRSPITPDWRIWEMPSATYFESVHMCMLTPKWTCPSMALNAANSSALSLNWLSPGSCPIATTSPDVAFRHPQAASLVGNVAAVAVPSVKTCCTPSTGFEMKHLVVSGRSKSALFQSAAYGDRDGSKWEQRACKSNWCWSCQPAIVARTLASHASSSEKPLGEPRAEAKHPKAQKSAARHP